MSRKEIIKELKEAVKKIEGLKKFAYLIPEVRTNFVYSLPNPKKVEDVCGVEGRITVIDKRPKACGKIKFGASDHLARLIMEVKKYEPQINSALNFKFSKEILKRVKAYCQEKKIKLGIINRGKEPKNLIKTDKKSMPWKIKYLYQKYKKIPQIFYETAGLGKEPLFVIVGKRPKEVVEILKGILTKIK